MNDITFRDDFGLWWPSYDANPERNFAYVTRNAKDLDFTLSLCPKKRVAVQAGGHAGIWPLHLAKHVATVYTFEPDPALFQCLVRNVKAATNISPHCAALSDKDGSAIYSQGIHAGGGRVTHGDGQCSTVSIDSLCLPLLDVLVLDIEEHEPFALRGAEQTVRRFRPIIHAEELPVVRDEIHAILRGWGYRLIKNIHKDGIWVP